jgi:hypothetical protein
MKLSRVFGLAGGAVVIAGAVLLVIRGLNPFASADSPVTMGDGGGPVQRPQTGGDGIFVSAPGFSIPNDLKSGDEHRFLHYGNLLRVNGTPGPECTLFSPCDVTMWYTTATGSSGTVRIHPWRLVLGTEIHFAPDDWQVSGTLATLSGAKVDKISLTSDPDNKDICASHPCKVDHCFNQACQ